MKISSNSNKKGTRMLWFEKVKGGFLDCWLNKRIVASISPTLHVTETRGTVYQVHIFRVPEETRTPHKWGRTKRDAKRLVKLAFAEKSNA